MTKLQAIALFAASAFVVAVFGLLILGLASLDLDPGTHDILRHIVSLFALIGLSIPAYVIFTSRKHAAPATPSNT